MFKNPLGSNGRIRRSEYGISFILYFFAVTLLNLSIANGNEGVFFFYIPVLWFLCAQGAKRCHDLGRSGMWQFIPFYGLWMFFQSGTIGLNKYGPDPKDPEPLGLKDIVPGDKVPQNLELDAAEKEVLHLDEELVEPLHPGGLNQPDEPEQEIEAELEEEIVGSTAAEEPKKSFRPRVPAALGKWIPLVIAFLMMLIMLALEYVR
jgi:uncharacterized membrane protein YhaH (DUF805 family)